MFLPQQCFHHLLQVLQPQKQNGRFFIFDLVLSGKEINLVLQIALDLHVIGAEVIVLGLHVLQVLLSRRLLRFLLLSVSFKLISNFFLLGEEALDALLLVFGTRLEFLDLRVQVVDHVLTALLLLVFHFFAHVQNALLHVRLRVSQLLLE